jgi:hypothetical protein
MPLIVTENWSKAKLVLGASAVRVFTVTGAANQTEACRANGLPAGQIPQYLTTYPQDVALVAGTPTADTVGFGIYEVTVNYGPAYNFQRDNSDPILQPPRFFWQREDILEPIDVDADGNPLLNSALAAFDPPPEIERAVRILMAKRYESNYQLNLSINFEDHVNSDPVTLPLTGGIVVPAGYMLCKAISPNSEYDRRTKAIEIGYTFAVSSFPWRWRFLDQGFTGWANFNGKVRAFNLFDHKGQQWSREVRLDGGGAPFNRDEVRISADDLPPVNIEGPKGATIEKGKNAAFMLYDKYPKIAFSGLNLF